MKFKAEISLLSPAEGGRKFPIYTGYRPNFQFDGTDFQMNAAIFPLDGIPIGPGGHHTVYIEPLVPELLQVKLHSGTKFFFYEGPYLIGSGTVIEILIDEL